jgi:hypothetical protein
MLELEPKGHRLRGLAEHQQEGVPGSFDLFAFRGLVEQFADQGPVLLDEGSAGMITEGMLKRSGLDDVGEDQSDQSGPVSVAESLDLCPVMRCIRRVHSQ